MPTFGGSKFFTNRTEGVFLINCVRFSETTGLKDAKLASSEILRFAKPELDEFFSLIMILCVQTDKYVQELRNHEIQQHRVPFMSDQITLV